MVIIDQSKICSICGAASSVSSTEMTTHHIQFRSRGGGNEPDNLILLCNKCHDWCNAEKKGQDAWTVTRDWDAGIEAEVTRAISHDGTIHAERWRAGDWWDEGVFVAQLQQAPMQLEEMARMFRFLSQEGIEQVAEALVRLNDSQWTVRAKLGWVIRLSSPYGETTKLLEDVARTSGISARSLYNEMDALKKGEQLPLLQPLQNYRPEAIRIIAAQPDPEKALTFYEDRRAEKPLYTASQLERELTHGADSLREPQGHNCPECGLWHYFKKTGERPP